jgi:hypothetical protein
MKQLNVITFTVAAIGAGRVGRGARNLSDRIMC